MKESSANQDTVASRTDYAFKPTKFVSKSLSQTVIKVRGVDIVQFINTSPITVTNILDGNDNQDVVIYGDGQTTLQANTNIVTLTGSDLLLEADKLYQFINFLGAWRQLGSVGGGGGVSDGNKGDITVSLAGTDWRINNRAVRYADIQAITTGRLLGRTTAGAGDIEEISVTSPLTFSGGALGVTIPPFPPLPPTVYSGSTVVDFGSLPGTDRVFTPVIGQTGILTTSVIHVSVAYADSANHSADEHLLSNILVRAGDIIPGTGFTIYAYCNSGLQYGQFNVKWSWV